MCRNSSSRAAGFRLLSLSLSLPYSCCALSGAAAAIAAPFHFYWAGCGKKSNLFSAMLDLALRRRAAGILWVENKIETKDSLLVI